MSDFFRGTGLVIGLELRQRVRGVAWYVLLGVFALIVAGVTALLFMATNAWMNGGGGVFSTIIFFVLLLATLVSPALSGNAINGDREAGTLATTQVTLLSAGQIVVGKFLAAWITSLAFLAAALPFLVFAVLLGEVSAATVAVSTLVLAVELGFVAALGVGLSGIVNRPLFSIVLTYLVIAALSIGTLIAFGLAGASTQQTGTSTYIGPVWDDGIPPEDFDNPGELRCGDPQVSEIQVPRFDYYWGILAANPYVVLADAAPVTFDEYGSPRDLFGFISVGVRSAQQAPELDQVYNECAAYGPGSAFDYDTPQDIYDRSVPSWFVGLAIHVVLAAGALLWAWRRTNTPTARLPHGSRVA